MFDPASHRDFLGACLGCGIDRRTVGDIIVTGERGAQVLCTPEIADFISASLTQVNRCYFRAVGSTGRSPF